jgi:outer membrane protein assembly factor BamB
MVGILVKKVWVCIIVLMMCGLTGFFSTSNSIAVKNDVTVKGGASSSTDWWPMFHHDLNLSGFTTSSAPSSNRVLWSVGSAEELWYDSERSSPAVVDGKLYVAGMDSSYPNIATPRDDMRLTERPNVENHGASGASSERWYEAHMVCFNAATGETLWNRMLPGQYWIWGSPTVAKGNVYIVSSDDIDSIYCSLFCLNALSGEILWNFQYLQYDYGTPVVVGDYVYVAGLVCSQWPVCDCYLNCLNASSGILVYSTLIGSGCPIECPSVEDNRLYLSVWDRSLYQSYVYCVNLSDGLVVWGRNLAGNYFGSSPVLDGSSVFISGAFVSEKYNFSGIMWCFNALTGAEKWNYSFDGVCNAWSAPAIVSGRLYFAASRMWAGGVEDGQGEVVCLDAGTGSLIWNRTLGEFLYSAVAIADGKLYVDSFDYSYGHGMLSCLNVATGDVLWTYWLFQGSISSPVIAEGRLFLSSSCVYAFDDAAPVDAPPVTWISGPHVAVPGYYNFTFGASDPEDHDVEYVLEISLGQGGTYYWSQHSGETSYWELPFNEPGQYWMRCRGQDRVSCVWSNWTTFWINISETRPLFLIGFISSSERMDTYSLLNASLVLYLQKDPFLHGVCRMGDQIFILNNSSGHVGSRFVYGRFNAIIWKQEYQS